MHVAQKCAAVLGKRHASKQRFEARRLNTLPRAALQAAAILRSTIQFGHNSV
jgi:hypothetical protein